MGRYLRAAVVVMLALMPAGDLASQPSRDQQGGRAEPRWNFHEYLIAADGRLLGSWPSGTEPDAPAITQAVEMALPAAAS